MKRVLFALAFFVSLAFGQADQRYIYSGTSLPATCPATNRIFVLLPSGNLYSCPVAQGAWHLIATGGGGTPAPPANSVQYDNAGAFGGSSLFTFDPTISPGNGQVYIGNSGPGPTATVTIANESDNGADDYTGLEVYSINSGQSATSVFAGVVGSGTTTGLVFSAESQGGATALLAGIEGANGINAATTESDTFLAGSPTVISNTATTQTGFHANNQGAAGITTSYGVLVDAQSGSTTNHAIGLGSSSTTATIDPSSWGGLVLGPTSINAGPGAGAVTTSTAFGHLALNSSTGSAANDTAFGYEAGESIASTTGNTFIGSMAGQNVNGNNNVAIGYTALEGAASSTAASNTAIGESALLRITTGASNLALGFDSELNITTGGKNVALGPSSLQSNTTGSANTAIGNFAGYHETGSNNLYVSANGFNQSSLANDRTYSLMWGVSANGAGTLTNQTLRINATVSCGGNTPSSSAGTLTGCDNGGVVTGLNATTTVTITFANAFANWSSCTANTDTALTQPYVTAISTTAVTFTYPSLTGTNLYYHCDGA